MVARLSLSRLSSRIASATLPAHRLSPSGCSFSTSSAACSRPTIPKAAVTPFSQSFPFLSTSYRSLSKVSNFRPLSAPPRTELTRTLLSVRNVSLHLHLFHHRTACPAEESDPLYPHAQALRRRALAVLRPTSSASKSRGPHNPSRVKVSRRYCGPRLHHRRRRRHDPPYRERAQHHRVESRYGRLASIRSRGLGARVRKVS